MGKKLLATGRQPLPEALPLDPAGGSAPDPLLGARHGPPLGTPGSAANLHSAVQQNWDILRLYCQLRHRKGTEFWRDKNEADQSDPRKLEVRRRLAGSWSSISDTAVDVEAFNQFFADKDANVHQNTSGVPSPTFSRVQ